MIFYNYYLYLELCQFINKLDSRYQEKVTREGILVARKTRKEGSLSKTLPRHDAPQWTIDPLWTKGTSEYYVMIIIIFILENNNKENQ